MSRTSNWLSFSGENGFSNDFFWHLKRLKFIFISRISYWVCFWEMEGSGVTSPEMHAQVKKV